MKATSPEPRRRHRFLRLALALIGVSFLAGLGGFGYGVVVGQYHVFPYRYLKGLQDSMSRPTGSADAGRRLFGARCSECHGADGNGGTGPNLHTDIATSASHRAQVREILRKGIRGTAMPDLDLSSAQISNLMAYLETLSTKTAGGVAKGDAARGRELFTGRGRCQTCHRVDGRGGFLGPDLSDVAARRWPSFLRRSLVEPSSELTPGYRSVHVVTRSGVPVTGILLNQSEFSIQLLSLTGRLRSFQRSDVRSVSVDSVSLMPSYATVFDSAQIADVVAYLSSLRTPTAP